MAEPAIAIVQPVIPDYRVPLFASLAEEYGDRLRLYAGTANADGSIAGHDPGSFQISHLDNRYLLDGRFLWQRGFEKELRTAALVIANGSLRILSTLDLLRRRSGHRPTVLWGHVHGRNENLTLLRNWMIRYGDGFLAYTDTDAALARRLRRDDRVWSARNSCVWQRDCVPAVADHPIRNIVFVGRLIADKKPMLALKAFHQVLLRDVVPRDAQLVFVGSGPCLDELTRESHALGLVEHVRFEGHLSETSELRSIYGESLFSVSPGYVGLSAIQSFAFGVPMLVARHENHSPEVEACREGFNTYFLESDSVDQWADGMEAAFAQRGALIERRTRISTDIASHYTYDRMLEAFRAIIDRYAVGNKSIG